MQKGKNNLDNGKYTLGMVLTFLSDVSYTVKQKCENIPVRQRHRSAKDCNRLCRVFSQVHFEESYFPPMGLPVLLLKVLQPFAATLTYFELQEHKRLLRYKLCHIPPCTFHSVVSFGQPGVGLSSLYAIIYYISGTKNTIQTRIQV